MDKESLRLLVDELFEVAEWYGSTPNSRVAETFALGWVAGVRKLSRAEVEQFRGAVNQALVKADQQSMIENLIQSAIRNQN